MRKARLAEWEGNEDAVEDAFNVLRLCGLREGPYGDRDWIAETVAAVLAERAGEPAGSGDAPLPPLPPLSAEEVEAEDWREEYYKWQRDQCQ